MTSIPLKDLETELEMTTAEYQVARAGRNLAVEEWRKLEDVITKIRYETLEWKTGMQSAREAMLGIQGILEKVD